MTLELFTLDLLLQRLARLFHVLKRELTAVWNGEKILDVNLDDHKYQNAQERPLAERAPFGYIGLQAYSTGAPVEFRNIRIKVLRAGPHFSQDR